MFSGSLDWSSLLPPTDSVRHKRDVPGVPGQYLGGKAHLSGSAQHRVHDLVRACIAGRGDRLQQYPGVARQATPAAALDVGCPNRGQSLRIVGTPAAHGLADPASGTQSRELGSASTRRTVTDSMRPLE